MSEIYKAYLCFFIRKDHLVDNRRSPNCNGPRGAENSYQLWMNIFLHGWHVQLALFLYLILLKYVREVAQFHLKHFSFHSHVNCMLFLTCKWHMTQHFPWSYIFQGTVGCLLWKYCKWKTIDTQLVNAPFDASSRIERFHSKALWQYCTNIYQRLTSDSEDRPSIVAVYCSDKSIIKEKD